MSRWPNKYVIGLTGNIAVGKSVVRQMLQHLGAYTIDADGLSHQAMAPGAPAYRPVAEMFGRFVLMPDGRIDRAKLGSIVFAVPEALAALESIIHPVVLQAITSLATRATQRVIVIEAIKLLETDLVKAVDTVWVVDAAPETQLRRLIEKRGLPPDEARKRIAAQQPQAEKLRQAGRIIRNDGNVDDTWRQVQAGWADVQRAMGIAPARPAPVASQPDARPAAPERVASVGQLTIRRGMPGNAELIAGFLSQVSGRPVSRMDVMLSFGQKSYLLAMDAAERVVGIIGWQVENLITRADEFYLAPNTPREPVIRALVEAVEEASKELQSEVGFILLPPSASGETIGAFQRSGYEATSLEAIRIPAWREAVHEMVQGNPRILTKRLRADRVMKPI